jgi:Rha family phage regulatory protein
MNELITINIDEAGKQTVSARDLHCFLESKQDFSTWIKHRINQYGFVENNDFVLLHKIVDQVSGAKHMTEYHLTIDMAKELSMVERNEKGKQARQYFIEVQRKAEAILKELEAIEYKGNINGLVFANGGNPVTNSRVIAKVFEKNHFNVMRDIKDKVAELSTFEAGRRFNALNFECVTYLDRKGEVRESFNLTEQGFSFIVLGYTGSKANRFKVDFINAFFTMRTALLNRVKSEIVRGILPKSNGKRNFVYIIGNKDNDYLKIGVSNNVDKRLKQLQTGAWSKLELLYQSMVCSNGFDVEANIHALFKDKKVLGEWFDIELNEAINLIESDNFTLKSEYLKDYYENNETCLFSIQDDVIRNPEDIIKVGPHDGKPCLGPGCPYCDEDEAM